MDQHLAATDSSEFTAVESAETAHTEQDVVGGITLSGRNRACARARVLAGMVLTSGIVITLSSLDTSVSAPN
ncbi:hypothetical protein AB0N20_31920 [Streptomyces griseoincarnatus]|uniref:hypothetical protein n=1 Tax=unclassified Streptomyces TaxID=2593676 RepID=UPI0018EE8939|nr:MULTISPECIES: hypothetical protein [unclassified Streptomyces]MBJ6629014.1 hypothetical protein [Streptomyces sp. I4(2020)]